MGGWGRAVGLRFSVVERGVSAGAVEASRGFVRHVYRRGLPGKALGAVEAGRGAFVRSQGVGVVPRGER